MSEEAFTVLKDYLKMLRVMAEVGEHNIEVKMSGLSGGQFFRAVPLCKGMRIGKMGMCYKNAYYLAMRNAKHLHYVEGFATVPNVHMPILHAFCVDAEGNVYDPTWPEAQGCAYWGVPFKLTFVERSMVYSGMFGVSYVPDTGGRPFICKFRSKKQYSARLGSLQPWPGETRRQLPNKIVLTKKE